MDAQWRSKALRGPGSTITWGPYHFPPLSLSSLPYLPSLSFLSLPFLSILPSPTLPPPIPSEVGPFNPARGSWSAVSTLSGVWGGVPAEIEFGAF